MSNNARSLNLSVSVGVAVFEARRQFAGKSAS
jgi:tRNA(Leu) C34 or U34 (ribose-2'-O)-methylase TrmL